MDANEHFEAVAHEFYAATGFLAPGKDDPIYTDPERRQELWKAYCAGRKSTRAVSLDALTAAPEGTDGK